jgi:purine-binding chemotaxis protein CheW
MSFEEADFEKYLIFEIGGSLYASKLDQIERVLEYSQPRAIPNAAKYFKGVVNFRGDVIGVFHLSERFNLDQASSGASSFVVYDVQNARFAAVVDKIHAIQGIAREKVVTQVPTKTSIPQEYLTGLFEWKSQLILIIDLKKILTEEEISGSTQAILRSAA